MQHPALRNDQWTTHRHQSLLCVDDYFHCDILSCVFCAHFRFTSNCFAFSAVIWLPFLQNIDAIGWAAGRVSGL